MTDLADQRGVDLEVYQPAEDSRFLAETVLDSIADPDLLLDVGTGSGYVAARMQADTDARVVGADLNPNACREARSNGVEAVRCDLVAPFEPGQFDVVTFNPPYLPIEPAAERDEWLDLALSGGATGRAVIDRFLADAGRILAPAGSIYLLLSTLTGVREVVEEATDRGFHAAAIADLRFPGETLTVLKLFR